MTTNSASERLLDASGKAHGQPFLWSHRAHAACNREFARITDELSKQLTTRHVSGESAKPVVRQSPGRLIVQVGPVALTVAWLRSTLDHVGDGELLVILWKGTVAQRGDPITERRTHKGAEPPPVSLWEYTFTPFAEAEVSWTWRSKTHRDTLDASSADLATQLVDRLVLASIAATPVLPADVA